MIVVATEGTSSWYVQVNQNSLSESLIAEHEDKGVEMILTFHVHEHEDNPKIHTMTLFNTDVLSSATNLHFQILDDRTNVGPANIVVLSFLTVKEEAVSKSNKITTHLW